MCGACVSDCTAIEVDKRFLGPAALAKAYRFVGDPRDDADNSRLQMYSQPGGIWDCTRCLECVQVCPKGVAPMDRIMGLRDKAIEAGYSNNNGARHTEAFSDLVKHGGTLDELRLPLRTFGMFNIPALLGLSLVGLRAGLRGKTPPIFHKAIPGVDKVRRIFEKWRVRNEVRLLPRLRFPRRLPGALSFSGEGCERLGLEIEVMEGASCTGAGVLQGRRTSAWGTP